MLPLAPKGIGGQCIADGLFHHQRVLQANREKQKPELLSTLLAPLGTDQERLSSTPSLTPE